MSIRKIAPHRGLNPAARRSAKRIGGEQKAADVGLTQNAHNTRTPSQDKTNAAQTTLDVFDAEAVSTQKSRESVLGQTSGPPKKRRRIHQGTRVAQMGVASLRQAQKPSGLKKFLRATTNALVAISIISGSLMGSYAQAASLDFTPQQTQEQRVNAPEQNLPGTISIRDLQINGVDVNASVNAAGNVAQTESVKPISGVEVQQAAEALKPAAMAQADPMVLLDGIDNGKVRVDIPLKAGRYDAGGGVKVPAGTVLQVEIEVQDGKLVPASAQGGTKAVFSNSLDAKAWIDVDGLYLSGTNSAGTEGRLMVDLSGFFDQGVTESSSLELGDFVKALMGKGGAGSSTGTSSATSSSGSGLKSAFEFDKASFSTSDIQFASGTLDLGSAQLSVDAGTSFKLLGTANHAVLSGQVELNGGLISQDGTQVQLDKASGALSLKMHKTPLGTRQFRASVQQLDVQAGAVELSGTDANGRTQNIRFGDVSLQNASVQMRGTASRNDTGLAPSQISFSGEISGSIQSANLNLSDGAHGAGVQLSTPHFQGQVDLDQGGLFLDGSLEKGQVKVQGLDLGNAKTQLSIQNGSISGDAQLQLDKAGGMRLQVEASDVDITLSDLQSSGGKTDVDLGKTQVSGSGSLTLRSGLDANSDGLHLSGDLKIHGVIDDLQVRESSDKNADVILDVRAGSQIGGQLRQLNLPSSGPLTLEADIGVNASLERLQIQQPSFSAVGTGSLQGAAHLLMQNGNLNLNQSTLVASLNVDDAKIAQDASGFNLDVAQGSSMNLQIQQLSLQDDKSMSLELGAGSSLQGQLDSGSLQMNGQSISFDKSTSVRFDVQSASSDQNGTSLRGQLQLNVGAETELPAAWTQGLPTDAKAQGQLTIADVQLFADGSFALNDVQLNLEGQLGSIEGAQNAQIDVQSTNPTSLRKLLDANPQVKTHQDLINILQAQNGNTFAGAANGAAEVGLSINDLVANRGASVDQLLDANVVIAPLNLASVSEVQAKSAAELIGLKLPSAQALDASTLAGLIESGTLKMKLPLSGDIGNGAWMGTASFAPGTVLEVEAAIVDGKIVPDELKANFNNAGDGPAWVTVNGVYLDDDQTLRLDLGGMVDFAVPGMENLPMNLSALLNRLSADADAAQSSGASSSINGGIQFENLSFAVDDIELQGDLPTSAANLSLGENTSLSLHGDLNKGRLFGQVDLDNASIDGGDIALQGATGEASFELSYERTDAGLQSILTLEGAELQVNSLGQRNDNGDFVHLENASTSGRVVVQTNFTTDKEGIPTGVQNINADAQLGQVDGDLVGARVSVPLQNGGVQQVELGPSSFTGDLTVNDNQLVSMNGNVSDLVAQLRGGDLEVGSASVAVDSARLVGSGNVHFDGTAVSVSDADVALMANLSDNGAATNAGPVRVVGGQAQLHVRVADLQNLTFDAGALQLDADSAQAGVQISAQQILGTSWSASSSTAD